jgi:hypothetical protein
MTVSNLLRDGSNGRLAGHQPVIIGLYLAATDARGDLAITLRRPDFPECQLDVRASVETPQDPAFPAAPLGPEHEIEELDRIVERQQAPVMQIGRRVLDAAQRERLDRTVAARQAAWTRKSSTLIWT